jgi:hypothetical protein
MTNEPWEPQAGDSIGTLGDDAIFMGFTKFSTEHQAKHPVDKLPFDERKDVSGWNFVVRLHVEV